MAEENEEQQVEKSGGPGWLVAILMGVAGLGAGFGGAMVAMPNLIKAEPAAEEGAAAADAPGEVSFAERVYSLDPFVVNVSGEGYPRYLKVALAFELDSAEAKAAMEERLTQVRDLTILLLSSKRLSDVEGFEGKALLKDDLRERVNSILSTGEVQTVLFTEFVVQ